MHGLVDLVGLRPDEERANEMTGGRACHQVPVDVVLFASGRGAVMSLIEPAQELDGFGDLLFRHAAF